MSKKLSVLDIVKQNIKKRKEISDITESKGKQRTKEQDENIIYLPMKDASGEMVVRFLPNKPKGFPNCTAEDVAKTDWNVLRFLHTFTWNGTNMVYHCPTSIGKKCPICEYNTKLWKTNDEKKQAIVSKGPNASKRNKLFFANVLVKTCEANPEWEGKVKILCFKPSVFEILKGVQLGNPKLNIDGQLFWDTTPDDTCEGQDFLLTSTGKMIGRNKQGQPILVPNYTDPSNPSRFFGKCEPITTDEDKLEELLNQCFCLEEYILDESLFNTYEDIEKRLKMALNENNSSTAKEELKTEIESDLDKADTDDDTEDESDNIDTDEDTEDEINISPDDPIFANL